MFHPFFQRRLQACLRILQVGEHYPPQQQYHQLQQLNYQVPYSGVEYTGVPNTNNYDSQHSRTIAQLPLSQPQAQSSYEIAQNYQNSRSNSSYGTASVASSSLRQHLTQQNQHELVNQCRPPQIDPQQQSQKPTDVQQSISAQNPSFQLQQRSSGGGTQRQPNAPRPPNSASGRGQRKNNESTDVRLKHDGSSAEPGRMQQHYQQSLEGAILVREIANSPLVP